MKKPIYKKWWFWPIAIVLVIVVIGILCNDDSTEDTALDAQNTTIQTPTTEFTAEPAESSEEGNKISSQTAVQLLESSFDGVTSISYDSEQEALLITPTGEAFVDLTVKLMNGDSVAEEDWNALVESTCELSTSFSGYIISIVNPANTDNTLLMVYEGAVLYDFAQE